NGFPKAVADPTQYEIFCAAKFDETCENPNTYCDPATDPKCPIYTKGSPGKAATLKCPGMKWEIDEKQYLLDHDPVCKPDFMYNSKSAVFYTKLPSGAPRKTEDINKHKCFTEYDCTKRSKLNIVACDENKDTENKCAKVDDSNGILKCADNRKLQIYSYRTNATILATTYTCDKSSGNWINATGDALEIDSRISCPGNSTGEPKNASEADLSDEAVLAITGVIIVLAGIGILVGAYYLRRCWLRRKFRAVKENKCWRTMKKSTRIQNCKNLFSDVMEATPTEDSLRITHGFNQIQLLLDEQIQDAECWEEAYPFLMRFQGAIRKKDFRIWHMFTRYMYLEAKKILDKHGWLSKKPIRNNKEDGLLRVAAIQMLSFALCDPTNEDAEELIIIGWRKLGFKAVEQYPHCGVLWTAMMHARGSRIRKRMSCTTSYFSPRWFKYPEFIKTLRTIAFEDSKLSKKMAIPAKDVMPVFGTVAQQAAFALGSSPKHTFHMDHAQELMTTPSPQGAHDGGTVQLTYFEGICMSLTRNPVPLIMMALRLWPNRQPVFMEKIHKIAPASLWNELIERTSRIVIYYGRPLDAKRLLDRFIPTRNVESLLGQLNLEQQRFADTMDKQLEEVREWFETRTDIETLKGKPVYTTDGNKHLDARIDADAAKAEAPAAETDAAAPAPDSAAPNPNAASPTPYAAAPNAATPIPNPAAPTPNAAATVAPPAAP
ncbi:hypothetical protein PENTCL1PPCAC_12346, partial [Pristionchus entomophagus]